MKNNRIILIYFITNLFSLHVHSQDITGFWAVEKVTVGEEIMTPVAKWFKINEDNTSQAGNGWLQNATGTWAYDTEKKLYTPINQYGLKDEFGAFRVSFEGKKMYWEREEEGLPVKVTLYPITEMPRSITDQIHGMWAFKSIKKEGKDMTKSFDPENKHYLFVRWDRLYVSRTPDNKRNTGYWHINGHRPEVTLLPHAQDQDAESWQVSVNNEQTLTMIGISESNKGIERIYERIDYFPN